MCDEKHTEYNVKEIREAMTLGISWGLAICVFFIILFVLFLIA